MQSLRAIDRDAVRAGLIAAHEAVLSRYGIEVTGHTELRGTCPLCSSATREPWCLRRETGQWTCHACQAHGDLLALIAQLEDIDIRADFGAVLAIGAEIAGITPDADPTAAEQMAEEHRQHMTRLARERAERRAAAEAQAPIVWGDLRRRHRDGWRYLQQRGLDDLEQEFRFGYASVCLPLHDPAGRIVNVVSRRIDAGEPKIWGLRSCRSTGTFGKVTKSTETTGPVVVTEGWADYASARILRPERLVLGAHGAGQLPRVVEMAAAVCRERGILFVPHVDPAGIAAVKRAAEVARACGIPEEKMQVFALDAGDLNDYLRARKGRRHG